MEGLLETQIRERRFQIWNKIQSMYIIPDDVQKAIRRCAHTVSKYGQPS
jgi:hypothetical protein